MQLRLNFKNVAHHMHIACFGFMVFLVFYVDSADDVCAFVDKFVSVVIPNETPTNKHISDRIK